MIVIIMQCYNKTYINIWSMHKLVNTCWFTVDRLQCIIWAIVYNMSALCVLEIIFSHIQRIHKVPVTKFNGYHCTKAFIFITLICGNLPQVRYAKITFTCKKYYDYFLLNCFIAIGLFFILYIKIAQSHDLLCENILLDALQFSACFKHCNKHTFASWCQGAETGTPHFYTVMYLSGDC